MYEELYYENKHTGERYPQSIYHNKPSAELKSVGNRSIQRVDAGIKVTGRNMCANDVILPGMSYLKFKLCPHSHAKVASIDTSKAKALLGVIDVLTHKDIPDLLVASPDEYVLQEKCYHDGDEVAAVLAEEEDIAEEAIALIDVKYDVLPFVLHAEDALKAGAPILRGETNLARAPWTFHRGNVDTGFSAAEVTVGPITYGITKPLWTEDRETADIECDTDTVYWDGERLLCWSFEKHPYGPHTEICDELKLPFNKVSLPGNYQGAVYGGNRGGQLRGSVLAAYLALKHHRPVKSKFTTEQQMASKPNQKAQHLTIKAGAKKDGTLTAVSISNVMDMGCLGGDSSTSIQMTQHWWNLPNLYLEGKSAVTNTPPRGNIRCTTHPRPLLLVGMHMDRLAEAVGMDPADFFLKNVFTGSGPDGDPDNKKSDMCANPEPDMLQKLIQVSGWKNKWKGWKTPVAASGSKRRGIGISEYSCSHGSLSNPMSAVIKANTDGTFTLQCGSNDIGQGSRTALALIAAEELGVPADKVVMVKVDTGTIQESKSPGGSTVTRSSGTAVVLAARDMKQELFKAAIAGKLIAATKPEDLEMSDGYIYLKANAATKVEVIKVTAQMAGTVGPIIAKAFYSTKGGKTHRQRTAAVAEVEVDVDTGEVQVLNVCHMVGAGRVIWYKGSYNQVIGGVEMSCGRALYEGLTKDEATGAMLNPNYLDYKIPTMMDSPNIDVNFHEQIDPYGPLGAVGMGEPIVGPPAIAVANAIYNACGARLLSAPFTPDKILAALGKA